MKKLTITILTCIALCGCANKNQQKVILDDILKVHDKVMGDDEAAMKNKMQLDTLIKQGKAAPADTASILSKKLEAADSAMENWMHNFDPEAKGKSEDENVSYMNGQKKQIMAVDSALSAAVTASNQYLLKHKSK